MRLLDLFRRSQADEAEKYYQQALRFRARKNREFNLGKAIHYFNEALKLEPTRAKYYCALGKAYVAAPLLAVTRGLEDGFPLDEALQLAIAQLILATKLKPDYQEAFLVLGEAYMYSDDTKRARLAFQSVLDTPGNRVLKRYARKEMRQLEEGLSASPEVAEAKRHLGQAISHRKSGKFSESEKELYQAMKLAPDWAWLVSNIYKLNK